MLPQFYYFSCTILYTLLQASSCQQGKSPWDHKVLELHLATKIHPTNTCLVSRFKIFSQDEFLWSFMTTYTIILNLQVKMYLLFLNFLGMPTEMHVQDTVLITYFGFLLPQRSLILYILQLCIYTESFLKGS